MKSRNQTSHETRISPPRSSAFVICPATVAMALLLALGGGCATKQLPALETQPAHAFGRQQTKDGLTIALRPMTDREETKKYFGTDLLAASVLAVEVAADNQNPSTSYLLSKDGFVLGAGLSEPSGGGPKVGSPGASEALGWTAVAVTPATLAGGVILMGVAVKMMSDSSVIKHNFTTRQLQVNTLSPGKSAGGFVYFPIPKGERLPEHWNIQVLIPALNGASTNTFDFQL